MSSIERFGTTAHGAGDILHVPFVKAGHWVFGTGLRAITADGSMDPAVIRPGRPLGVAPKAQREAEAIFARMGRHLEDAGSTLSQVARLDQYYPDSRHVDPYHVARKQALAGQVAPSTSVIVGGLLNTDAAMDVQVLAATKASGYVPQRIANGSIQAPKTSGYAPCLRVGDLVFVAGQLARDANGRLATDAMVPPGELWNGTQIKLETEYLIRHRLVPALAAAGSNLDAVLKAQVYLTDTVDLAAFWQVWSQAFGHQVPPTTVVAVTPPAFGTSAASIEVNLVAVPTTARERVRDIRCDVELIAPDMIPAKAFDGILFVAGLMAVENGGLCVGGTRPASGPYFHDPALAQMKNIHAKAEAIFAAAGTDLSNVVRALHFQTDLRDFRSVYAGWDEASRNRGLPFSAIQVAPELFVPGARLIVDLWGHVPDA
jgi:enamine deaminase RidA (YjgF/YER057c/UK114 family)